MTRARSLSLLANTNALTVDANQNVGIGSTIPDARLDVDGDMNVSGTLTYEDVTNVETAGVTTTGGLVVTGLGATIGGITTFFGDLNFGAAGVGGTVTPLGHAEFAGVVTATSFSGNGAGLTGVASTDNINTSTLAQFTGGVGIADSIFHIEDSNTAIRFPAADTFSVETAGSERLRVRNNGVVAIGTDESTTINFSGAQVQILGSISDRPLSLMYAEANSSGPQLNFAKGRDGDNSASTAVNSGDLLGSLHFAGADGSDFNSVGAEIVVKVDGTPGSNDMPGRIEFKTTSDGASTTTERLRITSAGNVGINSTVPSEKLDVDGNIKSTGTINNLTVGRGAGNQSTNTALGFQALNANTSGTSNVAGGYQSLLNNDSGLNNTGFGYGSLKSNTSGDYNIGLGLFSAQNIETGNNNVALGANALNDLVSGSSNVAIGYYAGRYLTGSNNTILGAYQGTGSETSISDTVIISAGTAERLRIGSSGQIGLGGANYGTSGQVLTSNGSGSAVTWEDASGGGGITTQVGNASGIVTSMFLTDATDHKITATGICTITTTQAGIEGQSHTIRIVNSGSATVGFSTYFLFPSGSTPSLPTADGAVSLISFTVHDSVGAGCTQLLAGASVNFS